MNGRRRVLMLVGRAAILGLVVLLSCLAATAGAMVGPAENPTAQDVVIVRAEFGLFNTSGSSEQRFVPSSTVPYVVDRGYGWIILIETKKPKVRWREELTLPAPPATWGEPEKRGTQSISDDKRVSVIEREVEPKDGLIFNVWAVAAGDPKGHYVIRVIIEDHAEHVFEFDGNGLWGQVFHCSIGCISLWQND
jgi:hypothetical protein